MKTTSSLAPFFSFLIIILLLPLNFCFAKENIIQQEKMTFEKCLKVITVSADKLSIAPNVSEPTDQKRIAIFTLSDGELIIDCDGQKGSVTVSTKID